MKIIIICSAKVLCFYEYCKRKYIYLFESSFFLSYLEQLGTRWVTELWPALRFRRPSACGCARVSISRGESPSGSCIQPTTLTLTHMHHLYHLYHLFCVCDLCSHFCLSPPTLCVFFYSNGFTLGRFWWLSHILHLGVQINLESNLWIKDVSLYCFGKYSMSCCIGLHSEK